MNVAIYSAGNNDSNKLAIVLPGFLDTKDYPHMRSHVEYLGEQGYLAVSFDPPGAWESGEDNSEYTITNYLQAIDDVIAHLGNKPTVLVGHSMGGMMAMLLAKRNPHVAAFVAIMSPYSYVREDNYQKRVVEWKEAGIKVSTRDLPGDSSQKREFRLPYAYVEDASQYNALDGLKALTKPKLFIIGEDDDVVPREVTEWAYTAAAKPKELVVLKSDHDYRWHPQLIEDVNSHIGKFLKANLR